MSRAEERKRRQITRRRSRGTKEEANDGVYAPAAGGFFGLPALMSSETPQESSL